MNCPSVRSRVKGPPLGTISLTRGQKPTVKITFKLDFPTLSSTSVGPTY